MKSLKQVTYSETRYSELPHIDVNSHHFDDLLVIPHFYIFVDFILWGFSPPANYTNRATAAYRRS
jgi:hypothetical protein